MTVARQHDIGLVEWLRPGEYERTEQVLADLRALGVTRLRTQFSWADWHTPTGRDWYDWLLPRLSAACELLPCFTYTPPSLGLVAKTAAPPRDPQAYADFIDVIIDRLGGCFEWIELWNEPNNLSDWDFRLDPGWQCFADMIGKAAYWAQRRGKKTLLGGLCPFDPHWLDLMGRRGLFTVLDAVGLHGFPGTWDHDWPGWPVLVSQTREVLARHSSQAEVWISETGYATWRHDEREQINALQAARAAPVERLYWYALHDLHPDESHQAGFHADERHYHLGLKRADGQAKLLYRLWREAGLDSLDTLPAPPPRTRQPEPAAAPVLITGGAGFVGVNLARHLLADGQPVRLLDNLSRPGVEHNLRALCAAYPDVTVDIADVRDAYRVRAAVAACSAVVHLAAQVAVTTSLVQPAEDFAVNAQGTLNVLEAIRRSAHRPPLLFTSTNKVYGALADLALTATATRYQPPPSAVQRYGIDEQRPLDFYSPYGCSKGSADQYVLDYARSFGLNAVVFRMSCIYGPAQRGNEEQGWLAHFLIQTLARQPLTLYGDGRQVRDVLYVDDLVTALRLALGQAARLRGRVFNIGGGPQHTLSLLELLALIEELTGLRPPLRYAPRRPGDQHYYVSDYRAFRQATGWQPRTAIRAGVSRLHDWLRDQGMAALPPTLTNNEVKTSWQ